MYVQLPASKQAVSLACSSGEEINAGSEHTVKAEAAQASATIAENAVYAHPPELVHVAAFSLAVPVRLTELQPLDASSSYRPAAQGAHAVANAAA